MHSLKNIEQISNHLIVINYVNINFLLKSFSSPYGWSIGNLFPLLPTHLSNLIVLKLFSNKSVSKNLAFIKFNVRPESFIIKEVDFIRGILN